MPFWDEIVAERASAHPGVSWRSEHIDALCAKVVLDPGRFDVIVASNLFGDILSDLAAAVAGSIGMAPSANIDPTREFPSMFEPVHGSAPDIAGRGHGQPDRRDLDRGHDAGTPRARGGGRRGGGRNRCGAVPGNARTPDLGGTSTTTELTRAIIDTLGGSS